MPPKYVLNSSKLVIKIGSNAGPLNVSPTKPRVVTPTLCATNDKSFSDVYTPGETKTLFEFAIDKCLVKNFYSYQINIFVFTKDFYIFLYLDSILSFFLFIYTLVWKTLAKT